MKSPLPLNSYRESVANVLEHEARFAIIDWLRLVNAASDLIPVRLSNVERCAHLPELLHDIVKRLRGPSSLSTKADISLAACKYGCNRRAQGYTPIMIIEESRVLQIAIFETLQLNLCYVDTTLVLGDVMTIADEVQSQLAQAMKAYLGEDPLTALSQISES